MKEQEFLTLINSSKGTIRHLLHIYAVEDKEREDLCQEIILQAWKSRESFQKLSSFNTWLYKIALFTILTFLRNHKKISYSDIEHVDIAESKLENDLADQLYLAISELDDLNKAIITMHLDGFSNPEIADFFGVNTNNINVKLHRIKDKISKTVNNPSNGHQ